MVLIPAFASASTAYEIRGRPSKGRSGFKQFSPALRRREPDPAIKITASELALLIARNIFSIPRCGRAAGGIGKSAAQPSIERHRQPLHAVVDLFGRAISEYAARPIPVWAPPPCCVRPRSTSSPPSLRSADHVVGSLLPLR